MANSGIKTGPLSINNLKRAISHTVRSAEECSERPIRTTIRQLNRETKAAVIQFQRVHMQISTSSGGWATAGWDYPPPHPPTLDRNLTLYTSTLCAPNVT